MVVFNVGLLRLRNAMILIVLFNLYAFCLNSFEVWIIALFIGV